LSATVPGYISSWSPINLYDPDAPDQYPLNWYKGNRQANIDLLAVLQPRNLQVPPGFVFEIPVSVDELPGAGYYLLLHTGTASLRSENQVSVDQGAVSVTKVAASPGSGRR